MEVQATMSFVAEDVVQPPEASSAEYILSWKVEIDRLHVKLDKLIAGQARLANGMQQTGRRSSIINSRFQFEAQEPLPCWSSKLQRDGTVTHNSEAPPRPSTKSSQSEKSKDKPKDIFQMGNHFSVKLRDFTPKEPSTCVQHKTIATTLTKKSLVQRNRLHPVKGNTITANLLRGLPLMPNDPLSLFLDAFSVMFLCYDCVMIPYALAWNMQLRGFFLQLAWATASFWTIDCLLCFVKAYTQDGHIVTELRKITLNYLARRFLLDFLIVAVDWMSIILQMSGGSFDSVATPAKALRILKITRILRVVSVLNTEKVVRMRELVMRWSYILGVDMMVSISGNLFVLMILILYLNHVASCAWVALQASDWRDTSRNWEQSISQLHNGVSFMDAGLSEAFQYFTAYYWSVSAMFSGSSTLQPMNTVENIFSSVFILCGVLFASCIVSNMSAMLIHINEVNRDKNVQMQLLRQFLKQRNVDAVTCMLVQRQALLRMERPTRIAEHDVLPILLLSSQLREQLHLIIWKPALMAQPLLRTCAFVDGNVIHEICKNALESNVFAPGQVVFAVGSQMHESYIAVSGNLQYVAEHEFAEDELLASYSESQMLGSDFQVHGYEPEPDNVRVTVLLHQHICEVALWAEWTTLGSLETASTCEVLSCSARKLIEKVFPGSPETLNMIKKYGAALLAFIQTDKKVGLSDLCSAIDYDAIVALMPQEERVLMSMPYLMTLRREAFGDRRKMTKLEDEIRAGLCNLGLNETGAISRTVRLVVLHMEDPDGHLCVKLGHWQQDEFSIDVELPGTKTMAEETLDDCKNRILKKYFTGLTTHITFDDLKVDVSTKPSKAYGVPTKYIRTALHAKYWPSGDHSNPHVLAKEFGWNDETVSCFVSQQDNFSCSTRSERYDEHDLARPTLLAWMSPAVYAVMTHSIAAHGHVEQCITAWANACQSLGDTQVVAAAVMPDVVEIVEHALFPPPTATYPKSHFEGGKHVTYL